MRFAGSLRLSGGRSSAARVGEWMRSCAAFFIASFLIFVCEIIPYRYYLVYLRKISGKYDKGYSCASDASY